MRRIAVDVTKKLGKEVVKNKTMVALQENKATTGTIQCKQNNRKENQQMANVNVLVVIDVLGAVTSGNLQNNVYLIDSRKYMGSWQEGQCELQTVCIDSEIINWRVASVDPGTDVKITGFTGQMVNDKVCVPTQQGLPGDKYWAGRVQAQGFIGFKQYSIVVKMESKTMTFDPYINIKPDALVMK